MKIYVPNEIREYKPELRLFMELMVRKLHVNRHKGFAEGLTPRQAQSLMHGETDELKNAMDNGGQFEASMEAVDVANTAFIVHLSLLRINRSQFEDQKPSKIKTKQKLPPYTDARKAT